MLLDELGLDLQTAGIGTRATDLFESRMPDTPDACVALFDGSGAPPLQALRADVDVERPRVTAWARAATAASASEKMRAIYERWRAMGEANLAKAAGGTTRYLSITAAHSPFVLERDASERVVYACSFDCLKEVSTS